MLTLGELIAMLVLFVVIIQIVYHIGYSDGFIECDDEWNMILTAEEEERVNNMYLEYLKQKGSEEEK